MRLAWSLSLLIFVGCGLSACAAESSSSAGQTAAPAALETDDQKMLYTLGNVLGRNIGNAGLSEDELRTVALGLTDSALGREPQVDLEQYGPNLQGFMQQRIQTVAAAELTETLAFVKEQAGVEGAVLTDSGIVIEEMAAGSGASPTAEDTVQVHYHGTLRDGSVFDSSVDRGEPASFPLNGVIPCWTEALQTMQVGGKSRLVCPPDLAYGPEGRPGIPGNAALVFEVELLDIVQ
jgi:FKBP-type peptidyl-prolyl cis-trans isomerase FkpA